jgi:NADH-quinone oxidoreductase subunit N
MTYLLSNFFSEIFLLAMSVACIVSSCISKKSDPDDNTLQYFVITSLILLVAILSIPINSLSISKTISMISKNQVDISISIITLIWVFFDKISNRVKKINERLFFAIIIALFSITVAKTNNLITFYIAIECQILALYFLILLTTTKQDNVKAVVKYFIFNIITSAILLVSIAVIFHNTKTLKINEIIEIFKQSNSNFSIGFVIFYIAIIFKLGIGPMVFWLVEIYQKISYSSIYVISISLKLPLFLFLSKTSFLMKTENSFIVLIALIFTGISTIPIAKELKMKNFLCYNDSISSLYLLLAFHFGKADFGESKIIMYFILQSLSIIPYALIANDLERLTKNDDIYEIFNVRSNYKYLASTVLTILSISSIPPFCGFWAKIYILENIVKNHLLLTIAVLSINVIMIAYLAKIVSIICSDKMQYNKKISDNNLLYFAIIINTILGLVLIVI